MGVLKRGRTLAAGLVVGALIGTGVAAVTPAGAAVKSAAASIDWKQVWKKEIKPRADKRYYTKKQSNNSFVKKADLPSALAPYVTSASLATQLAGYYTKPQVDAALGNYYTKAQSDAKYAPFPSVIRGVWLIVDTATAGGQGFSGDIEFGSTLTAAPTVHVIPPGGVPPAGCSGSVGAPDAAPGHLCIFQRNSTNVSTFTVCSATNSCGNASPFGAYFVASSTAAGLVDTGGSYAVRPLSTTLSSSSPAFTAPRGNAGPSGR